MAETHGLHGFRTEATKRRTGTATDVPSFEDVKGQSWNFQGK